MNEIQTTMIQLSKIEPNKGQIEGLPKNPRLIRDEHFKKLKKSIEDNPEMLYLRELLVFPHQGKYIVIGGNMRLMAMRDLKYSEAPCKVIPADTTVEQLKAYTIKDNASFGEYDFDMLANEWDFQQLQDWCVDVPKDVDFGEKKEAQEDDFDEEKDEVETVCKNGDIWQLGQHRLMCGDSTDAGSVAMLMDGEKADLWLTDPPYNVALGYEDSATEARKRHRRTDYKIVLNDSMPDKEFRKFLIKAYTAAKEAMKAGASYYIFHADNESYNFRGALRDVGDMQLRETLIWVKDTLTLGRQDYQWRHEPCLYGWKEGVAHKWYNDRKQTSCIEFPRPKASKEHPTMKPVKLFSYLMENSTQSGDIVLDTFGGSGTTLIACEQLNRKCYMMELDEHYCDVIIARWEKYTGKKAEKITNN